MLKEVFTQLTYPYTNGKEVCEKLWNEIEKKYSSRKRYYHNLTHLENLFYQLNECRNEIADWPAILFSLFYHDIIYNVLRKDNEARSAELAVKRLQTIHFPESQVKKCHNQILATSAHVRSDDHDTNLFTDADLSILGQSRKIYEEYCNQIRKEYGIYPDMMYKPGRRKVIEHFLSMERIYKTQPFFDQYEIQAKRNLRWELEVLK